ncbi:MAG: response regulator [Chloroflexota bacterium]
MKFLVVDDAPTMRRIIKNTLASAYKADAIEAEDGAHAWSLLDGGQKVDCVLTDWNMPNMNGLELTKRIRSDERFSGLPVIMITTRGSRDDLLEALRARVDNYIVKPFSPHTMREKIKIVLDKNSNL